MLEYSWSHDWHAEWNKKSYHHRSIHLTIMAGDMECSWRYWLSVQSKNCISNTHRTLSRREMVLSGRLQEAMLKQSCRTELWQTSHFDLQSAHFGDRRKLNPTGGIAWTLSHSAFFIQGDIKALCQGGIVINLQVLPFRHFPCRARGKTKGHGRHWDGCYACKGRHECMHAVGFWNRKALARCWADPQELVWHGNHTVHWMSFYSHRVFSPV